MNLHCPVPVFINKRDLFCCFLCFASGKNLFAKSFSTFWIFQTYSNSPVRLIIPHNYLVVKIIGCLLCPMCFLDLPHSVGNPENFPDFLFLIWQSTFCTIFLNLLRMATSERQLGAHVVTKCVLTVELMFLLKSVNG